MKRLLGIGFLCLLLAVCTAVVNAAAIHDAAAKGNMAKVKSLLKSNKSLVNAKDKDDATPLHYAAAAGRTEVAKFLISKKCEINARKKDGVMPLHVASACGKKGIVELLLASKADVNAADNKGRTPLTFAQLNSRDEIAAILRASGATGTPPSSQQEPVNPHPTQPAPASEDVVDLAQNVVKQLAKGDYKSVLRRFDAKMKSLLSEEALDQKWLELLAQSGAYIQLMGVRKDKVQGFDTVTVACDFERARVNAIVSFDGAKKIAGLYLNPTPK